MTVKKAFWIFLAVLAACGLGVVLTQDEFYYKVISMIGILILLSFCWAFMSTKGIQVKRFARVSRQQVGQLFDETIELENQSRLVRLWLELRDKAPLPGSSGSRVLSWIEGKSIRSFSVYTLLIQRGEFSLGPTIISSGDPLGLFSCTKVITGEKTLLVLPFSVDLKSFLFPSGLLPGGKTLRSRSLEVTPHAAGVREYVYGDSVNRIHWATTARRDKLMVKEFDKDPQADVWVILDSCQNGHFYPNDFQTFSKAGQRWFWWSQREEFRLFPSTYEYCVSSAASIVKYFIRLGQAVGFVSVGQLYVNLPPERGERQLGKVLETLAFLKAEGDLSLQGLVESQIGALSRGSVVVLVTPSVRDNVILAVEELILRELRPIVILIDPLSFGSSSIPEALIGKLTARGIPLTVIRKDANLKEALEESLIPSGENF